MNCLMASVVKYNYRFITVITALIDLIIFIYKKWCALYNIMYIYIYIFALNFNMGVGVCLIFYIKAWRAFINVMCRLLNVY